MSALDEMFRTLRAAGRKALLPFVTAGDPDLAFTQQALQRLSAAGAAACEVGFPYSDPIADGPVIQASYTRALAKKVRTEEIFAALEAVRGTTAPLVSMVSYAIVHRLGPERFLERAAKAGLCGAIIPDLLVEEAGPLAEQCRARDFALIQLVTPTTPRERALRIAETSSGFLYYVSVTGITGERSELPAGLLENVAWLRERTPLPVCIGFGISTPEHVRRLAPVADGVIVGSAIVRRVAEAGERPREEVLDGLEAYARELMGALG
jgi:tryptophan synthase alpha chain